MKSGGELVGMGAAVVDAGVLRKSLKSSGTIVVAGRAGESRFSAVRSASQEPPCAPSSLPCSGRSSEWVVIVPA